MAQGMALSTLVPGQSLQIWAEHPRHRQSVSGTRTSQPPCVLMPGCHVPTVMLAWCPQPQCSQLVSPEPTSQRCLELLAGAALDPSSGLSSTAPRAALGSAGPSGSGWQLAGTEPAGRDREAVARTCYPVPPLLKSVAQTPGTWGPLAVPERGRGSGCSGSGSWGTAWSPPSWLCSCARSRSEKERSLFSGTSVAGESSSYKAMGTVSPRAPWHPPCLPISAGSPLPQRGSSPPSQPGWVP